MFLLDKDLYNQGVFIFLQRKDKMKQNCLLIGIILLLIGASITPSISGTNGNNEITQITEENPMSLHAVDWWPMPRHDLANTGCSTSKAPDQWVEYWKYSNTEYVMGGSVILDDKLYIGTLGSYSKGPLFSRDQPFPMLSPPMDGRMLCIDTTDGGLAWQRASGLIISSAAVDGGKVFYTAITEEEQGKITCLNAQTGTPLWERTIQYFISAPLATQGKVYIAHSGINLPTGTISCLNATTGNQVWTYTPSLYDYITCTPAILDDKLYCARDTETGVYLSCLNAATGQLLWDEQVTPTAYLESFSVAVADGIVLVASSCYQGAYGTIFALDATTGGDLWQYQTGEWYVQWPDVMPVLTVAYNNVYAITLMASYDSTIYCLDLDTGSDQWSQSVGDPVISSPAIADGKLYFTSVSGLLYCLDAVNGGFIWSTAFQGGSSAPAIANETIFAVHYTGMIYAYGASREPMPPTITGPTNGNIKTTHEYTFSTTDPQEDLVFYYIDWGDGQTENWVGPYESDEPVVIGHSWTKKGTYTIKAKAKDVSNFESGWGELSVTMPTSTFLQPHGLLERLFERFPTTFPLLRNLLGY